MKSVFERKFQHFLLIKKKNDKLFNIDTQERTFKAFTNGESKILNARVFYAASKINALVRGFLDRVLANKLRKYHRAMALIQRIMKGKIGRLKWRREFWRSISIVKSDMALKELIDRSSLVREKVVKQKKQTNNWKEYYDPLTECFWYYNSNTRLNTWEVPVCFQSSLICHWNGYESFGATSSASLSRALNDGHLGTLQQDGTKALSSHAPCRCIFKSTEEYHNHLRTAHKWYCVACLQANPGLSFPKCNLCQNKYNEDGIDGESLLKQKVQSVEQELLKFIQKDIKQLGGEPLLYSVRERLIDIGEQRKDMLDSIAAAEMERQMPAYSKSTKLDKTLDTLKSSYSKSMKESLHDKLHRKSSTANVFGENKSESLKLPPIANSANKTRATSSRSKSKPLNIDALLHQSRKASRNAKRIKSQKLETTTQFDVYNNNDSLLGVFPPTSSITKLLVDKRIEDTFEEEKQELDPILKGVMNESQFQILTSVHDESIYAKWKMELISDDEEDNDTQTDSVASIHSGPDADLSPINNKSKKSAFQDDGKVIQLGPTKEGYAKLIVCSQFFDEQCRLTTCPYAHPGIRDSAKINYHSKRLITGQRVRTPYVIVCPFQHPCAPMCEEGKSCRYYHTYVRPSTQEIILSLYPMKIGHTRREFEGGAVYVGSIDDNRFNGYGTMHWSHGAVYMGDWKNNLRHGFGIFRTKEGLEYIGSFVDGKRDGWGVLHNANGEEYVGQWKNGKMEGLGILYSPTGDTYRGYFQNNHYHGVGYFSRANGDMYMGYCIEGRAHGLGILSLSTGEKYKGHFERNARHGKGACAYPNGARYAGQWYRGVHDGFGIFLMQHVKYIGNWKGGKKHGYGRYYFPNGEFYDGEFAKNKAKGVGAYYFLDGNIFTGEWDNDKRNGRGTYLFTNGSKYTGNWVDNNIHGKGKFDFANGAFYRGQFDWNTKHGKGIYTWPNGNEYKGDFIHEKLHGKGEMKYIMGHRYVGDWVNNEKHGQGVMLYANGALYEGQFQHDIRQGMGKLTLVPNSPVEESYEGEWDDDQWHGKGKYTYRKIEGTVYDGDWVYGVRQGYGVLSYKDGSYYRGEFRQNQMWGKGVYVGSDYTQYDGDWRANMRQGFGTSIEPDGSIYNGEFFGNMKQGKGKVIRPDGTMYEGQWDANIIIGSGKATITVGDPTKRDGLPKKVTLRVFSY